MHVRRDIGDGNDQPPPLAVRLTVDRVVKIARIFPINGHQWQVAEILSVFHGIFGDVLAETLHLPDDVLRPFAGKAIGANGDVDFHPRGHVITQNLDDPSHGL